jgi:hypothetical protein
MDPKIQIVKKIREREKHSLKSNPLINSSICFDKVGGLWDHSFQPFVLITRHISTCLVPIDPHFCFTHHPPLSFYFFCLSETSSVDRTRLRKTKKIKRERGAERQTSSTLVKDQENM